MEIDRKQCPDFFLDYILYITVTKSLSARTVQEYYLDIRLFLKYLRMMHEPEFQDVQDLQLIPILDMKVSALESVQLQDIYNYLYYVTEERENHDRARGRKVSALRSFFGYLCHHQNAISHDPTEHLELPSPKKTLPRYLTLEQSQQLLLSLDTAYPERDYCILTLFLNCGIRLSELVGLNITDINFKEAKMRVLGKGNKERYVPLPNITLKLLRLYWLQNKDKITNDYLFPKIYKNTNGDFVSPFTIKQAFEKIKENNNLDNSITFHTLRHSFACEYLKSGGDIWELRSLLGHSSINTTMVYLHMAEDFSKVYSPLDEVSNG